MSDFTFLNKFVLSKFSEKDLEKNQRHYLYRLDRNDVLEIDLVFSLPKELMEFYCSVGYGLFHKHHDYSFNRLMDPFTFKEINLREGFYEFDPELDSYEERYNGEKLLFFEVNEGIYLAIDKQDNEGRNAIYFFDRKIADSLEVFLRNLDVNPNLLNDI